VCDECGWTGAEGGVDDMSLTAATWSISPAAAELEAVRTQSMAGACRRCGGEMVHRADDDEQVVLERFKVYRRETRPLEEFYRTRSTFRAIDGAQPVDKVTLALGRAVESALDSAMVDRLLEERR
jgi:adenylate kinase family enzyme